MRVTILRLVFIKWDLVCFGDISCLWIVLSHMVQLTASKVFNEAIVVEICTWIGQLNNCSIISKMRIYFSNFAPWVSWELSIRFREWFTTQIHKIIRVNISKTDCRYGLNWQLCSTVLERLKNDTSHVMATWKLSHPNAMWLFLCFRNWNHASWSRHH